MRIFDVRLQSARSGNVSNSRPCKWAIHHIDEIKIEIDGCGSGDVRLILHTDEDVISIPLRKLHLFLQLKDEELSNLFVDYKRILYGKNG